MQAVKNLYSKLKNIIKIARLVSVDDSRNLRFGNMNFLGKNQKGNVFSPYGLVHNPPVNSMGVIFALQGQESNLIGIFDDPKNRTLKNLKQGEIGLNNYITTDYLYFDEDGTLKVKVTEDIDTDVGNDINTVAGNDINIEAVNEINYEAQTKIDLTAPIIDLNATILNINATTVNITATTVNMISNVNITGVFKVNGKDLGGTHTHYVPVAPGESNGVT